MHSPLVPTPLYSLCTHPFAPPLYILYALTPRPKSLSLSLLLLPTHTHTHIHSVHFLHRNNSFRELVASRGGLIQSASASFVERPLCSAIKGASPGASADGTEAVMAELFLALLFVTGLGKNIALTLHGGCEFIAAVQEVPQLHSEGRCGRVGFCILRRWLVMRRWLVGEEMVGREKMFGREEMVGCVEIFDCEEMISCEELVSCEEMDACEEVIRHEEPPTVLTPPACCWLWVPMRRRTACLMRCAGATLRPY